jgi:amino acid transporter
MTPEPFLVNRRTPGADATAHMSEEIRDAGRYVPIAMFWSYTSNGIIALILLITYLFSIDSVDNALNDPSGYPFIYVFQTAMPTSGVNALTIIILILVIAANIDYNASTSRQTFAFARDKGLPFAKWIGAVHPQKEIPVNAVLLSCLITALLSIINIGSDAAFNAIISVQVGALMLSYSVSISCILYRRLAHPELMVPARWSLGRWGLAINVIGLAYVLFAFFWSFWPNAIPVDLENFNWSVVIFVGVLVVALGMYAVQGRRRYTGPVVQVVGRDK